MTGIREGLHALWSAPDDAEMVQFGGRWHTWGEVRALVERIDEALTMVGCHDCSRIGVVLSNRVESVAALIAILGTGRTIVTLNPMQPAARVASDLRASAPQVVLAPAAFWDEDVFADTAFESGMVGFALDGAEVTQRCGGPRAERQEPVDEGNPVAVEMFTSGTTGPPKRVPLTWRQLDAAMSAVHSHTGAAGPDRAPLSGRVSLVVLALVHIGGMWAVLQALTEARPFVLLPRFTVDDWVTAVAEHKPRIASLPPAAMRSLLSADVPADQLASLRAVTAGTAFVSPDMADEFIAKYQIPVLIVYGATEFSGAVAGWTKPLHAQWWSAKRRSVGRPFPGVELRTVDENGDVLEIGQTGRLEVKAGQTGSGAAGWLRTSDLAHLDTDGFLYIDGRADDAIVRGGFKVQPEVVADALRAHPSILDACVFGRDDDRLGQVPIAAVELTDGMAPVSEDDLKAFIRDHLTGYEVPIAIHTVEALPRSASLKVDRRRLLELLADAVRA